MPFPMNLKTGLFNAPAVVPDNRDLLNVNNDNTIQSARYVNPATHDYEQSADNHLVGENYVDQQILLILNTTYNSAFVSTFGQNFTSIRMLNRGTVAQAATLLNQCLSTLIANGSITLQNVWITAEPNSGSLIVNFSYVNNTTGKNATLNFLPHS